MGAGWLLDVQEIIAYLIRVVRLAHAILRLEQSLSSTAMRICVISEQVRKAPPPNYRCRVELKIHRQLVCLPKNAAGLLIIQGMDIVARRR